ncbi:AI-2E family transporter [Roseovarius sp. SCSIO 43702]|uniref:AI-2E family transporter n=1 Tax=Roseovarius sp. SCSIO 43702 TaxID=2823043 RepID=UPI001C72BB32|nr:AI-2E family transporter [Roseovarius sp. SCSIO 43702]QYX56340.1 AI-2E family transporter [Roseovarius sp. SCSIO 43702]
MTDLNRLYAPVLGIFIILLMALMLWAATFLIPVTTAVLGYFVLSRPRRLMRRLGVPDIATAALFTTLIFAGAGAAIIWFAEPVARLVENLPGYVSDIQRELAAQSGGAMDAVNDAAKAVEEVVDTKDDEAVNVKVVEENSPAASIVTLAPKVLGQVIFAIFMMFFLLASGDFFLERTVESLPNFTEKRRAVGIIHSIEDRLGRYLGGITFINAGLGVAIGAAMLAWGIPNWIAIGIMAFALNYIPFLGALAGAAIAALIAFITFSDLWSALGVFLTYMALTSIEGQFVTPMLISRRMRLNTPVVFLVVAFFAYIWSVMGMVVAVPILIVIKITCDEIERLNRIGHFLGDAEDAKGVARKA